jgi:xylose dehydrogenase (NAD/NADP)
MTDRKLRWGVLSTANIGRAAVNPAIQASANGVLAAVASRDEARARAFAELASIPRWHGSYEALVDDPEVDALYIPLPNSLHKEWTIRAAEAGKHVLCEKPLALDAAECREMQAAADAHGVKLMEAFMYRFHPRTGKVLEMVRSGVLGDVRTLRSAFTFRLTRPGNIRMDPDLGGGALMDVGCYCVNVSRTVVGGEPVAAQARAHWAASGVDAELTGILLFEDGVTAHFDCSLTMERSEFFEVAGTEAWIRVADAFLPGTGETTIHEQRGRGKEETHTVPGADEYRTMVERFAESALNDTPVPYPAEEAARNMRAIEALYRSARAGGVPVTVEE